MPEKRDLSHVTLAAYAKRFSAQHKIIFGLLAFTCLSLSINLAWLALNAEPIAPRALQPLHTFLPLRDPNILQRKSADRKTSDPMAQSALAPAQSTSEFADETQDQAKPHPNASAEPQPQSLVFFDPRAIVTRSSALSSALRNNNFSAFADPVLSNNTLAQAPHDNFFGPSPTGIFFKLTPSPLTTPYQTAAYTLALQVPLANTFRLFSKTETGLVPAAKAQHQGLNQQIEVNPQADLIGFVVTDYPTRLKVMDAASANENHTRARQATGVLIAILFISLSVLLVMTVKDSLAHKWRPPWQRMAALFVLINMLTFMASVNINGWFEHAPLILLIGLLTLCSIQRLALPKHAHRKQRRPWLMAAAWLSVLWLAGRHLPVARGPLLLLTSGYLFIRSARLHWHWPLPTKHQSPQQSQHQSKQHHQKRSDVLVRLVLRLLPTLTLSITGFGIIFWVFPVFGSVQADINALWHFGACALAFCAISHGIALRQQAQYIRHTKAAALANQAQLKHMNRDILTRLSQHLSLPNEQAPEASLPEPLQANKPVRSQESMRSDGSPKASTQTQSRVNLSTIGESQQDPLEKVAEYADISALLDEDATWSRAKFQTNAWIERNMHSWSQRAHRQNLQLIVSIKPNTPITILADEEKISHILQSLLEISINSAKSGNIILRIDATENDIGELIYRFTLQDAGTALPDSLERLLKTNWLELMAKPLDQAHVRYARILLAHRWLYLAQGRLNLHHDPMVGTQFQVSFKTQVPKDTGKQLNTKLSIAERTAAEQLGQAVNLASVSPSAETKSAPPQPTTPDTRPFSPLAPRAINTLLMTYDADYATTMAEQANYHNNPMSLALSTKQALRNLEHAQTADRSFDIVIVDFSRDAESLQGFLFELKEQPEHEHTPVILLTHPHQRVDYLTQIMIEVHAMERPGYYPHLNTLITGVLFKTHPNFQTAIKRASKNLPLFPPMPKLSDL